MQIRRTIITIISLGAFMLLVGYIRDSFTEKNHKLWVNLISTGVLVLTLLVSLYIKEKSADKPNYKIYFYTTLFIFLSTMLSILLIK